MRAWPPSPPTTASSSSAATTSSPPGRHDPRHPGRTRPRVPAHRGHRGLRLRQVVAAARRSRPRPPAHPAPVRRDHRRRAPNRRLGLPMHRIRRRRRATRVHLRLRFRSRRGDRDRPVRERLLPRRRHAADNAARGRGSRRRHRRRGRGARRLLQQVRRVPVPRPRLATPLRDRLRDDPHPAPGGHHRPGEAGRRTHRERSGRRDDHGPLRGVDRWRSCRAAPLSLTSYRRRGRDDPGTG